MNEKLKKFDDVKN